MLTRLRRHAAVAALVTVLAAAPAAVAVADEGPTIAPMASSQCANGQFCLWNAPGYNGRFFATLQTLVINLEPSFGGTAGGVWNRSGKAVRVYSGYSGTGTSVCFLPGAQNGAANFLAKSVDILSGTTC